MMDPSEYQMPQQHTPVNHPRQGEPLVYQLPAVYQQVEVGPGLMKTVLVAPARFYVDDVSNRNPTTRDGEQA